MLRTLFRLLCYNHYHLTIITITITSCKYDRLQLFAEMDRCTARLQHWKIITNPDISMMFNMLFTVSKNASHLAEQIQQNRTWSMHWSRNIRYRVVQQNNRQILGVLRRSFAVYLSVRLMKVRDNVLLFSGSYESCRTEQNRTISSLLSTLSVRRYLSSSVNVTATSGSHLLSWIRS